MASAPGVVVVPAAAMPSNVPVELHATINAMVQQAAQQAATSSISGGVTGLAGSVMPQLPSMGGSAMGADGQPTSFMQNMMGQGASGM